MHKPFESVIALARFELSPQEVAHARQSLSEVRAWPVFMEHIELHGLSGIAAKHIRAHDLPLPTEQSRALKALNLRHRAASEARYIALQELSEAFANASIEWLALKGVALMPMLYGAGELRPMRDIDLLLPQHQLNAAKAVIRQLGYLIADQQPSKYMRDMHQLPNAVKTINGFTVSLELHHDGFARDMRGHCYFPNSTADLAQIQWRDLSMPVFAEAPMLNQVTHHLRGMHPGAVLKLINVMDVIGLAEQMAQSGTLHEALARYPELETTLRCLHVYTPLPEPLSNVLPPLPTQLVEGTGEVMVSFRTVMQSRAPLKRRLRWLLRPSDWWLHLYYNVDPESSLWLIKWVRHPLRLVNWIGRRMISRLRGG